MNRAWTIVLMVLAVALLGLAFAQEVVLPELSLDPRTWFDNPFALAAMVLAITSFVKTQFNTHGHLTLIVSFVAGIGVALAATFDLPYFGQLYNGTLGEAITYGATAAILASGGWDTVKKLLLEIVGNLGKRS
jgi:hypothetical protein